jgi:hypothetical protein
MSKISPYFENINRQILNELISAKESIFIAVAWFTESNLMQTICEKAANGVCVDLIISNSEFNFKNSSFFEQLIQSGGNVYSLGANEFNEGTLMHNKFCIIDFKTVITGSYNWTMQASRNDENIIVLKDTDVTQKYLDGFYSLRDRSDNFIKPGNEEIQISISADRNYFEMNEKTRISWKANNADFVTISEFGLVDFEGSREINVESDKIIVIKGTSAYGEKIKTIRLCIYKEPELSIKTERDFIIKGESTLLSWDVVNAEKVLIEPGIGDVPLKGSLSINPNQSTTFMLIAECRGKEYFQVINIRVFAVPHIKQLRAPASIEIKLLADIHQLNFTHGFNDFEIKLPAIKHIRSHIVKIATSRGTVESSGNVKEHLGILKKNYGINLFNSLFRNNIKRVFN